MKKLLCRGMLTLAASCVLASCANDEMAEVPMNEVKEVKLTTRLDAASRASVAGEELELFYTVYDAADGSVVEKNTAGLQAVSFEGNSSVTLTLQLERNKSYDIAFWAQPKGVDAYDLSDMKAIKVRYDRCLGNDSYRNAFYGNLFGLQVAEHSNATVSLKSPFGKLEVLTTVEDVEAAASIGIWGNEMDSSIIVSGVADTFNALYGTAEGEAVIACLQPGAVPDEVRNIDGVDYQVLTSDYLLTFYREVLEVKVALSQANIEDKPLVFTAGRAWLNKGETAALSGRFITHPIEFDATVNDWAAADASVSL